ncbi:glycosyltransferase 87 family protein [Streptomyces sp. NPDC093109]|uniref:glycosyltransferase 87 family protein n=1 Tax=Streptomyces sp. NPDC093109 TaxID=3154977 RepID=UPI00344D9889
MLALSLAALATLCVAQRIPMADALIYRAEGAAVVDGTDLYGPNPYGQYGPGHYGLTGANGVTGAATGWQLSAGYPPFAALLFVPTTWLPVAALKVVLVIGNAALLALFVRLSWRFAGLPAVNAAVPVTLAVAVALWLEPVLQTVLFGQISLAVGCLVLWDLSRPEQALGKGFALGVAAGITLTPAVFLVHLLVTGRVRAGLTALAGLTGTVLLGLLVLPHASGEFWTHHVVEFGRYGGPAGQVWTAGNQSLYGLLARALHTPEPGAWWATAAALTAAAGLWTARRAAVRAGAETWGVLAAALTALLVAPVGWSHHWVWCVPLLAVLLAERRFGTAAVAGAVWTAGGHLGVVPHQGGADLRLPWWQQPAASPYALTALGLLVFVAWRTRSHTRAGTHNLAARTRVPAPRTDSDTDTDTDFDSDTGRRREYPGGHGLSIRTEAARRSR